MKKIDYQAPEMEVVEVKVQNPLLDISGGSGPGKDDNETEFDE